MLTVTFQVPEVDDNGVAIGPETHESFFIAAIETFEGVALLGVRNGVRTFAVLLISVTEFAAVAALARVGAQLHGFPITVGVGRTRTCSGSASQRCPAPPPSMAAGLAALEVLEMNDPIEITVPANADADNCLADAAARYIAKHPELAGWDLAPRWTDESTRETVTLTVPSRVFGNKLALVTTTATETSFVCMATQSRRLHSNSRPASAKTAL